ncbi:hypothetical protein [Microvirga ossetica]|nr:hypothetical protein [Microvirga ossetica]
MTKSYSLDLRQRVVRFVEAGHSWICFGLVESGFVAIRPAFRPEPD